MSREVRILSGVSYEAWPSPEARRGPLPRIEDLPIGDQGYDQEAVRDAFDAFYRHAAQLDASLRALEAVDVFRREASELRADLRSLRALGFGGEPGWTPSVYAHERPRRELPAAVPRVAAEAALLIAVAVVAGVGHFRPWLIGAAVGGAWLIVLFIEVLAARARLRVPEPYYGYAPLESYTLEEPAPAEEPVGWAALEPVGDEVDVVEEDELPAAAPEEQTMDGVEPEPVAEEKSEPEPAVDEAAPRRRWFRRGHEDEEAPATEDVAGAGPSDDSPAVEREPWERGFDGDDEEAEAAVSREEPEVSSTEAEPELATRGGFGRIRRRR